MKDYASMSDQQINKLVAAADGMDSGAHYMGDVVVLRDNRWVSFDPCNNPADAWPIITANRIGVIPAPDHGMWRAAHRVIGEDSNPRHFTQRANPLRAAMIVFLKMKEGEK